MYKVFKHLRNGEFVPVASHDELEEAVQQVGNLASTWPGEYVVRDSEGNEVNNSVQ
jgi:hypothetical protein